MNPCTSFTQPGILQMLWIVIHISYRELLDKMYLEDTHLEKVVPYCSEVYVGHTALLNSKQGLFQTESVVIYLSSRHFASSFSCVNWYSKSQDTIPVGQNAHAY